MKPGQELLSEITKYCRQTGITSGIIIGIIGSAAIARLNYLKELPGKYDSKTYEGPLEIVAAQGSVALKGKELVIHIHIQLSNESGCFGGHLVEAKIFSTGEVVLGELTSPLSRYGDEYTGLNELL